MKKILSLFCALSIMLSASAVQLTPVMGKAEAFATEDINDFEVDAEKIKHGILEAFKSSGHHPQERQGVQCTRR